MTLFHLVLVALIQGITEFLPISSSGHLILLPQISGLEDQGQFIDVAVHVGTLGAVVWYFRTDVAVALSGLADLIRGRMATKGAFLALCLIIATIPALVLGAVLVATGLNDAMRSMKVIGWTMLVFGIVLYWADKTGPQTRPAENWTLKHAAIMGLWQALALIPGTSRSGISITGARLLGYAREDAARLAMLMSIPTILAAGAIGGAQVVMDGNTGALQTGAIAAAVAFVSALIALALMMRFLKSISFTPYVIYRVVLGLVLLVFAYS